MYLGLTESEKIKKINLEKALRNLREKIEEVSNAREAFDLLYRAAEKCAAGSRQRQFSLQLILQCSSGAFTERDILFFLLALDSPY